MIVMDLAARVTNLKSLVDASSLHITKLISLQQTITSDLSAIRSAMEKHLSSLNQSPDPLVPSTTITEDFLVDVSPTVIIKDITDAADSEQVVEDLSSMSVTMMIERGCVPMKEASMSISASAETVHSSAQEDVLDKMVTLIPWDPNMVNQKNEVHKVPSELFHELSSSHTNWFDGMYRITGGNELMVQQKWSVSVCYMKHRGFFQWCFKGGTLHLVSNVYHSSYLILNVTTLPYEDTQFACGIMSAEFICDGYESICGSKVLEMLGYVARYDSKYNQFREFKVMSLVVVTRCGSSRGRRGAQIDVVWSICSAKIWCSKYSGVLSSMDIDNVLRYGLIDIVLYSNIQNSSKCVPLRRYWVAANIRTAQMQSKLLRISVMVVRMMNLGDSNKSKHSSQSAVVLYVYNGASFLWVIAWIFSSFRLSYQSNLQATLCGYDPYELGVLVTLRGVPHVLPDNSVHVLQLNGCYDYTQILWLVNGVISIGCKRTCGDVQFYTSRNKGQVSVLCASPSSTGQLLCYSVYHTFLSREDTAILCHDSNYSQHPTTILQSSHLGQVAQSCTHTFITCSHATKQEKITVGFAHKHTYAYTYIAGGNVIGFSAAGLSANLSQCLLGYIDHSYTTFWRYTFSFDPGILWFLSSMHNLLDKVIMFLQSVLLAKIVAALVKIVPYDSCCTLMSDRVSSTCLLMTYGLLFWFLQAVLFKDLFLFSPVVLLLLVQNFAKGCEFVGVDTHYFDPGGSDQGIKYLQEHVFSLWKSHNLNPAYCYVNNEASSAFDNTSAGIFFQEHTSALEHKATFLHLCQSIQTSEFIQRGSQLSYVIICVKLLFRCYILRAKELSRLWGLYALQLPVSPHLYSKHMVDQDPYQIFSLGYEHESLGFQHVMVFNIPHFYIHMLSFASGHCIFSHTTKSAGFSWLIAWTRGLIRLPVSVWESFSGKLELHFCWPSSSVIAFQYGQFVPAADAQFILRVFPPGAKSVDFYGQVYFSSYKTFSQFIWCYVTGLMQWSAAFYGCMEWDGSIVRNKTEWEKCSEVMAHLLNFLWRIAWIRVLVHGILESSL